MEFANWFQEWADFGFEPKRPPQVHNPDDDKPVQGLNLEYVLKDLRKQNLGVKESNDRFFGEVVWGDGPGAVKLEFGPYGGLRAVIRKRTTDLEGQPIWICKRVIEVKEKYDGKPDNLVGDIWKALRQVDKQGLDSPKKEFKDLEHLTTNMAGELKRSTTQTIFIFEGIRRIIPEQHYIIHLGCTGMGVQRAGQKRLDQFQIDVRYLPEMGMLRVTGQEVGSPIRSHLWQTDPAQFQEWFAPGQSEQEIIAGILSLLNCY